MKGGKKGRERQTEKMGKRERERGGGGVVKIGTD